MNRRLLSVLLFALVISATASLLLYRFLAAHIAAQPKVAAAGRLLMAARDLQVGTLLTSADLKEGAWSGPEPAGAAKDPRTLIGRGVIATIYQDEPILASRLAMQGAGAGLASTIPIGKRAVALRVNEVIGLAGFVVPGMRVDVIVSANGPLPAAGGTICRTVLQNIEVLSAGQKVERTADGKPSDAQVVNLLVSPEEAEVLSLASSETKVQLVLRNPLDTGRQTTPGSSLAKLLGISPQAFVSASGGLAPVSPRAAGAPPVVVPPHAAAPPAAPPPAPKGTTVEVFHGSKKTEQVFRPGGAQ